MADPFRHLLNSIAERVGRDKCDPFLRKIDPRLHLHQQAQQALANLVQFFGQPSSQLVQCHSHAGFGARLDQIHHRFRLGEVQSAIQECAFRKLPRGCQPRSASH